MNLKRSIEVTAAGTIFLAMGLFFLVYFPSLYFYLKHIFSQYQQYQSTAPFPYPQLVISMIMAVSFTLIGFFLLRLRSWARVIGLFLMICWMIMGFAQVRESYGLGSIGESWRNWVTLYFGPAGVSIYLLTLPRVIEQFKSNEHFGAGMKKPLVLAIGSMMILLVLYLSAPYGVWDGSSVIGRMMNKFIFIHKKPAEPQNTEIRTVVTESAVVVVPGSRSKSEIQHNSDKVKNPQKIKSRLEYFPDRAGLEITRLFYAGFPYFFDNAQNKFRDLILPSLTS